MSAKKKSPENKATLLHGTVVVTHAPNPAGQVGELITDGCVYLTEAGTIEFVGAFTDAPNAALQPSVEVVQSDYLLPGLIDIHCHGGAGASFPNAESFELAMQVVNEHLRHGTTSLLASLVTDTREILVERLELLASLCEAGALAGIHSEGPFLSKLRCGAQDPNSIEPVDLDTVAAMIEAAGGHLRTMTYAPEVADADKLVATLIAAGVTPSIGHTDADATQTRASVQQILAGSTAAAQDSPVASHIASVPLTATHLFNGMRPVHHRVDGPILELMAHARAGNAVVEVIADNVHLSPDTVREVFDLVGANNVALVTDAMAAAGMPDGNYQLGAMAVTVLDGVARLSEGKSIAGGTAHLIEVVTRAVTAGVPLPDAVHAASLVPARVLGLQSTHGSLASGKAADVLLCNRQLEPIGVFKGGHRLTF